MPYSIIEKLRNRIAGAPGTHWIGGWVGPRAVLDTVVKGKIITKYVNEKKNRVEDL
jgi:hypothetical protein